MKILKSGSVWYAEASYAERMILKAARWRWHGGNCWNRCGACAANLGKVWWTDRLELAAPLYSYAADGIKAELEAPGRTREASLAASRAVEADIDVPAPVGLSYMPFQRAGIAYACARGRQSTLIADEMGLGKTIQALGVVNADPAIERVLVVCPATLRFNWRNEAAKWLVRPFRVRVIEGRELPAPEDSFVIVNYDKLVGARGAELRDALQRGTWDLLVVDEAHYCKNPKAKRTQVVLGERERGEKVANGLNDYARRRLYMTGTPILNRPVEIHPLLSAVAPVEFGDFWKFAKRYCNAKKGRWGWDFSGASNLPELQERMRATCMVRRLKRDVLTDLPAKVRQVVCIPPNGAAGAVEAENAAWRAHAERLAELRAEADLAHAAGDEAAYKAAVAALRDAARIAFTEISEVRHETALAKVETVLERIQSILDEGAEKLVVFAHHKDVIEALAAPFGEAAVRLTGDTPMAEREGVVKRFQTDPACRLFFGNIQAAGVGITLTAASHVVFAELDWVPANVTQAEDRCHRIGQRSSVLVQHLVLDGSLDARMAKTIVAKQAIADLALDVVPEARAAILEAPVTDDEEPAPPKYPLASDAERAAALLAMRILAVRCDGARDKDGAGFNKIDTRIGKRLASLPTLTDGQTWLAARIARKYHRQLPVETLSCLKIEAKP